MALTSAFTVTTAVEPQPGSEELDTAVAVTLFPARVNEVSMAPVLSSLTYSQALTIVAPVGTPATVKVGVSVPPVNPVLLRMPITSNATPPPVSCCVYRVWSTASCATSALPSARL